MITINLFTYKRDAAITVENVKCCRRHIPNAKVIVWDDNNNRMAHEEVRAIQKAGAVYYRTNWNRGGNLNGRAAVLGILKCLAATIGNGDIAIKVDADTVLRSGNIIDRMGGADGFGSYFPSRPFSGCCYGFRYEAILGMLFIAGEIDIPSAAPEDQTVFELAGRAGLNLHLEAAWSGKHPESRWTAWNWSANPKLNTYRQFEVITLGTCVRFNQSWVERMPLLIQALADF